MHDEMVDFPKFSHNFICWIPLARAPMLMRQICIDRAQSGLIQVSGLWQMLVANLLLICSHVPSVICLIAWL